MNEDFGAITILAPKCQQCPKVKSCDHKQMANLGYIVPQRGNGKSLSQLEMVDSLIFLRVASRSCSRLSVLPGSATRARIRSRRMGSLRRSWWAFW